MEEDITQNESSIKKVVICGPESTGKSTLTQNLPLILKLIMSVNMQETIFKVNGIIKKKCVIKMI